MSLCCISVKFISNHRYHVAGILLWKGSVSVQSIEISICCKAKNLGRKCRKMADSKELKVILLLPLKTITNITFTFNVWVWFFDFLIEIHYQYQKKVNVKISVILLSLSDFISKHQHTLQSGKLGRELLKTVNDLRAMLLLPVRTIATMKRKRVTKSITIRRAACA